MFTCLHFVTLLFDLRMFEMILLPPCPTLHLTYDNRLTCPIILLLITCPFESAAYWNGPTIQMTKTVTLY